MTVPVAELSPSDALRFQAYVALPAYLAGLVAPNPWCLPWLARGSGGRATITFLTEMRRKYASDHFWVRFPGGRTLLVLDPHSLDAVLAAAEAAADPMLKTRALGQFVPEALVISSGEAWRDRRAFNEEVLAFGGPHPSAGAFLEIVAREVEQLPVERLGPLRWGDFQRLGERVSHQVLLGRGRLEPDMAAQLARMVQRSNWVALPRDATSFTSFYGLLQRHLERHLPGGEDATQSSCLMHDSARWMASGKATPLTQVPSQIGFWFFVLKDAVELHVARTLALIAAHEDIQARVREEILALGPLVPESIDRLHLLEACLHEQLRLWTPVPILLRRAVAPFALPNGVRIEAVQQILIHAAYYHRDPAVFGVGADRFSPDTALAGIAPVYFFSRHRQSCAGQFVARLLIKATLAFLLARFRFELAGPAFDTNRIPCLYDHFSLALRSARA